jgi:tetratricopeptide (TPR) repeat protein
MRRKDPIPPAGAFYSLLLAIVLAASVWAATPSEGGMISGSVRDPSGKPLANVKVVLALQRPVAATASDGQSSSIEDRRSETAATTADGSYTFKSLERATYSISAALPGFESATQSNIDLSVVQSVEVNLTLVPSPAGAGTQDRNGQARQAPPKLQAAGIRGGIDPGGYSSSLDATTSHGLLEGLAKLSPSASKTPEDRTLPSCEAEEGLKKAVQAQPESFEANHQLGELYIRVGEWDNSIPYLEKAHRLNDMDYANSYDLAMAYVKTQNVAPARELIRPLLRRQDKAELHKLLAEVEVKSGNLAEATDQYRLAVDADPSAENIFDWGGSLLLRHAPAQAAEAFRSGADRYPQSAPLWIGLGVALYSQGHYDDAVGAFLKAADISPTDPKPYLFLAEVGSLAERNGDEILERLRRFVELDPGSAEAHYYYGLSLWKGKKTSTSTVDLSEVKSQLESAVAIDPAFASAHLQLGAFYAQARKHREAIPEYETALKLDPTLTEARYRLAQSYMQVGEQNLAKLQLQAYEQLRHEQPKESTNTEALIGQLVHSSRQPARPAPSGDQPCQAKDLP